MFDAIFLNKIFDLFFEFFFTTKKGQKHWAQNLLALTFTNENSILQFGLIAKE